MLNVQDAIILLIVITPDIRRSPRMRQAEPIRFPKNATYYRV